MNKHNGTNGTHGYLKKHGVIKAQQFDLPTLEAIFSATEQMKLGNFDSQLLRGKIMVTLFYEPSTRTRISHEMAMVRLGGTVISTDNARQFSSAAKGETLADSLRVVAGYGPSIIVIRYDKKGELEEAQKLAGVPIINAGDGTGQHPTQALLDLFTIRKKFGKLEGLKIAMVGDLANGRTVRSNCYLLAKHFPHNTIYLVSPGQVRMGDDVKRYLKKHGVLFYESETFDNVLPQADVIYQTRVQAERFKDRPDFLAQVNEAGKRLTITPAVAQRMKPGAIILHPLPRITEINPKVDSDPRAWYFHQAQNGLFVRMALLKMILTNGH
jgi:aspartate carbamoyltransferase catalytic subunit